jgi:excisionase family DNA binding protein
METTMNEFETRARQDSLRWVPEVQKKIDQLLTVAEFCKHSGMSETSVREAIADGRCPVIRYGKSIRISAEVLRTGWEQ